MGLFKRRESVESRPQASAKVQAEPTLEEWSAGFKAAWPGIPADYGQYMQQRWAGVLGDLDAGRPNADLGIWMGNLSGVYALHAAPAGSTEEDMTRWFDSVVAALGPAAEKARPIFMEKASKVLQGLKEQK